jgi:hypothetical protein
MKLYFAYGANLNIHSMRYRCPDAVAVEPMYLHGWRLAFSGVATIQPDVEGCVPGALWAISESDERSLDCFEGWPNLYRKEILHCNGLEFMVYVMNSDTPAEPSSGYLMTIAQGYQDWSLNLEELVCAVQTNEQEVYNYDLQWSSRGNGVGRHLGNLVPDVQIQSRDDVRWMRGVRNPDRYSSTLEPCDQVISTR